MEEQKYYFISFMKFNGLNNEIENSALDEHPMDWQMWADKNHPGVYKLITWVEIDKARFEGFAQ